MPAFKFSPYSHVLSSPVNYKSVRPGTIGPTFSVPAVYLHITGTSQQVSLMLSMPMPKSGTQVTREYVYVHIHKIEQQYYDQERQVRILELGQFR